MKASEVRAMCPKWVHGAGKPGGRFCEHLSPDEVWCRCDDIHCHVMPRIIRERQAKAEAERINKTQGSLLDAAEKVTPAQPTAPIVTIANVAPQRAATATATVPPVAPVAAVGGPISADFGAPTAPGLTAPADRLPLTGVDPKITEGVKRLIDETERIAGYLSETTWSFTRIGAGLSCMRKYWLKYIVRMDGTPDRSLVLGSFFHELIDAIDGQTENPDTSEMLPEDRAKMAQAVLAYGNASIRDQIGSLNFEAAGTIQFAGYPIHLLLYIDRVSRDGKTLFNIEYGIEWMNESPLQTARYCALALFLVPSAERVTFINLHRAKQKMKKGESETDFGLRLKNEVKEPWVKIVTYERNDVNVHGEMNEIGMAALHIAMGVIAGYSTSVTHSNRDPVVCGICEYNDLCEQWCKCWGHPVNCALKAKCSVVDACNENYAHRTFIGLK